MKNPSFRTWLLGSRLTAPPIILWSAWYTWQWWQAGGQDNTGIFTLALMGVSAKAAYQVAAHHRWRAEWRAMAPGGDKPGSQPKPTTIAAILSIIATGAAMLWASSPDAPPQVRHGVAPIAVLSAMLGVLLATVWMVGRALRRLWMWLHRQRQGKLPAVALAIKRPLLRVPSIRTCHRRLPPHCQMLLTGGKS